MDDFHRIRQLIISRLAISNLLKGYGVVVRGHGEWKTGRCPWHDDKRASFSCNDRLGIFHCFAAGCGKSGSIFDVIMINEGVSFWEAFCKLAEMAGVALPDTSIMKKKWGTKQKKLELTQRFCEWTRKELFSSEQALSYLASRGYNEETIRKLVETIQLGYLPEQGHYKAIREMTSKAAADTFARKISSLCGRIIAPWYDATGAVLGWWGRSMDGQEPKYLFSKGTKKSSPYLLHMARRGKKEAVLCVVEGLFDAGLAHVFSSTQVVATGGMAVPNPSQLQVMKQAGYGVVIVIPDADEKGRKAIITGLERLQREADAVGLELLVGELPPASGKDLDSVLVKAEQPVELVEGIMRGASDAQSWVRKYYQEQKEKATTPLETALVNAAWKKNAECSGTTSFTLGGVNQDNGLLEPEHGWTIPPGWHLNEQGIYRRQSTLTGVEEKKIAHTPFVVSARSVNIDTGDEQLKLSFPRDQQLRSLWLSRDELFNHRTLCVLARQGFPVTSRNAGLLVDYLADFEAANLVVLPRLLTVSSFGWKRYNGDLFFVLGDTAIGTRMNVNFVAEGEGEKKFSRALKSRGNFADWLALVREIITYPKVAFGLYSAFVPPLLPILDIASFLLDFCGETSLGKTTAAMVAASVYGDPVGERGGIVPTWNATSVSIERYASLFKALPIFLDDSHLASNQQAKSIIYMLSGGVGKMRGALKGTQLLQVWNTVSFVTGERPLVSVTKHEGAKARVIEFHGSPFQGASGNKVSEIKAALGNHFGHAGPLYLEKLISLVQQHKDKLRKDTDYRCKLLKKRARSGIDNRKASYFAAVWTAATLVEEFFDFEGNPDVLIPYLFEESCGTETDFAQKAMETITSWVMGNWNSFYTGRDQTKGELFGVIKKDDYVAIFPHKVAELCKREDYSYEAVVRSFRDRGWIRTDKNHLTVQVKYKNTVARMVKIPWKYLQERPMV